MQCDGGVQCDGDGMVDRTVCVVKTVCVGKTCGALPHEGWGVCIACYAYDCVIASASNSDPK